MLALLIVASASFVTAGSQEPVIVRFAVPFDAGQRYALELTKTREVTRSIGTTTTNESETRIEVEIVAKDDEGFHCRWTYGKTRITKPERSHALAEWLASMFQGVALDFRLDSSGSVVGFVDEAQARRDWQRHLAKFQHILADGMKPAELAEFERVIELTRELFGGELFEATMLKEPTLYYLHCGGEYEVGRAREYDDLLPNPFGGEPLPAKASVLLAEHREGEALLVWRQTLDSDKVAAMIQDASKRLADGAKLDTSAFAIAVEDCTTYLFDLNLGHPRVATWRRASSIDGVQQLDQLRFVLR